MRRYINAALAGGTGLAALAMVMLVPAGVATSADHLDPPSRTDQGVDPTPDIAADIADIFMWHAGDTVRIVLTFAGPVEQTAPLYYDRDVLYKINVSTQAPGTTPEFQIKARFGRGENPGDWGVRIEGVPGVTGAFEGPVDTIMEKNGVKAIAGQFDEPFFFDVIGFRETRQFGTVRFNNQRDFFANQNDIAIVLEIPKSAFGPGVTNLEAWAQTQRFGGNL
ncbi:DUF4331 domain-containing protein [Novosphingobium lubricantis]